MTTPGRDERETRPRTRRLFFALWPDEAMQQELAAASREVLRRCGGRPVPASNYHLTLAFLGSVAEDRLAELAPLAQAAAGRAAGQFREIRLTLDRIEHWREARVLCATASAASAQAAGLAAGLKRDLQTAGFAPDLKPFRAHVTLLRKIARAPRDLPPVAPVTWTFDGFALVESRTEPSGSLYSVLDSWTLCKR